jgi:beta-lactam-binding protein with PASTA domain
MPKVIMLKLPAAEAKIRSAITDPRFTFRRVSAPLPPGTVIAQTPAFGSMVAPVSEIRLAVSS